jgi:hypothetical protein
MTLSRLKGFLLLARTSRPVAHLRAARSFLREAVKDLRANARRCYAAKLREVEGENYAARELLLGAAPERLAREACMNEFGKVEDSAFETYLRLVRGVGERYGLL